MQDRYAGDLGDYSKLGLLRAVGDEGLTLGLIWALAPEESHNDDGRHVTYLDRSPRNIERFRSCDPPLYDALADMLARQQRSVAALEQLPIWPSGTRFHAERLSYEGVPSRERLRHRGAWLERAYAAVEPAQVVFVDPDNGMPSARMRPTLAKAPKFVWPAELRPLRDRGQSVVVYQHASRQGTAREQAMRWASHLGEALERPVWALAFRRGSLRFYLVAPDPAHASALDAASARVCSGPWGAHFERLV